MKFLTILMVSVVAALHFGFLVLEMFFWNHPIGQKIFEMTPAQSEFSAALAANQGLYNGILATGLIWGLLRQRFDVIIFFLVSIVIAGIFGAATAIPTILFIQALPAAIALILALLSARTR